MALSRPRGGRGRAGPSRRATGGRRVAAALALLFALGLLAPAATRAIVLQLGPDDVREAVEVGTRGVTEEEFGEEWRLRLPGGEEIVVTTPFARLAHAARQAALKEEPFDEGRRQEHIARGAGRLQFLVTLFGRRVDFARWYQPVLRVEGREVKPLFAQNERSALRLPDGRFAARNIYVFPLEGLPARGSVTLVVQNAADRQEVFRAAIDLGRMR